MSHYHFDQNRVFTALVTDEPDQSGNSTDAAPPPVGGVLLRFIDRAHGWKPAEPVDVNGMPLSPADYHLYHPDWVEAVVPMAERAEAGRMWDFANSAWWYPDNTRPIASHGEIMLISDQVARLAYKQESDEGQSILRDIHRLFPDAPVRENADGVMEAFHPETGEVRMCQPGGVRQSFAYPHAQFGLYIFDPVCPRFLSGQYVLQDDGLPRDACEYPGWWGYKFNVDEVDGELVAAGYSIKLVSRMPEFYDLPEVPENMRVVLFARNLAAGNFMDETRDIYLSWADGISDEHIDDATAWLEARGITSPYTGGSYANIAYSLYGLTFFDLDLSVKKAKFYFFSYDRVLAGIWGELVLQGRADLAGFVTPERPTA